MVISPIIQMRAPRATLESLRDFLLDYSPSSARFWVYGVSHRYFQLRVSVSESDYIMITMLGCSRLSGSTAWKNPRLELSVSEQDETGTCTWKMWDNQANFSAQAEHLYWGQRPEESEYAGWFSLNTSTREQANTKSSSVEE